MPQTNKSFLKPKYKNMKQLLKLHKTISLSIVIISLCFHSNDSYAQGLFGKIKKGLEAVNNVTNVVKNPTDVASVITGKGTGVNTVGDTSTTNGKYYFYESQTNKTTGAVPLSNEDLIEKLTLVNRTGRTIVIELIVKDDYKEIGWSGKDTCLPDYQISTNVYSRWSEKTYFIHGRNNNKSYDKTASDGGKFVYCIKAYYLDGIARGDGDIISYTAYNSDDLKKENYRIAIKKFPGSDARLAEIKKERQINKDANDPTKLGELTIVNAVGGKGKIFCVLSIPKKHYGSTLPYDCKRIEFILGENKGDKYVIRDLRLFGGCKLYAMPESEKSNYYDSPNNLISVKTRFPHSLDGYNTFQMAAGGLVINVGEKEIVGDDH
jgi:hypothetical protein